MIEQLEESLDLTYSSPPSADDALDRLKVKIETWQDAVWYDLLPVSAIGPLLVAVSNKGVVAIEFGDDEDDFVRHIEARFSVMAIRSMDQVREAMRQILQYLSGNRRLFDLEIDLSRSTDFERQVLEAAVAIPPGYVASYGEIAQRVGKPRGARAVGQAVARNPIPIVVPCHRVVGSDGSLTGYSGAGGIETKAHLLRLEGAAIV